MGILVITLAVAAVKIIAYVAELLLPS